MIIIVPHQPAWQDEFRALGNELRQTMGDLALRVDHIGSTSVPGLAAKDVIDIQITVAKLDDDVERVLNNAGYQRLAHIDRDHIPPGLDRAGEQWLKWFFKPASGRPVNLHVRLAGKLNQRYPLLFRDYLRTHEASALAYALVKSALARLHSNDIEAYYAVKDPVCDIIMIAAEAWASQTRWNLGASDC
jgi:GrpB-like predicted nucleotidyltransferase (UPF0157 family)